MDDFNSTFYENQWSETVTAIREEIDAGAPDLSRFLHRIHVRTITKQPAGPALLAAFGMNPGERSLALGRVGKGFIADTVLDHADGVDAIVELGAGWGYNLFNIWERGGPDIPYLAYDLTQAGVTACNVIAARFPATRVTAARYDFRTPTLPPMEGVEHALVFTAAAADKVLELPATVIEQIIELAPKVTVLHFESLAGQLGVVIDRRRAAKEARANMNTNLVKLLRTFEEGGRLTIDEVRPEVLGGVISMLRWSTGGK